MNVKLTQCGIKSGVWEIYQLGLLGLVYEN